MDGLDARIAEAFGNGIRSADVGTLIKEVESAAIISGDLAQRVRARALDPELSAGEVDAARRQAEDALFRRDRMQTALTKLRARLDEVKADEENARRQAAYDAAAKNRDEVAEELRRFYPEFSEKLVDLLSRLQQSNFELEQVNAKLPNNQPRLERAEFIAKDIIGKPMPVGGFMSVLEGVRISPWHPQSLHRWPR